MRLAAATRLGPYEVVSALGAGGMGEVYRARDTRLGRDVALKALPLSRYADPDLLARFEREAKSLAALNHPHIAALYETVLGFRVRSRSDAPHRSAVLGRDDVQIGLIQNGGDSSQDGCAFHVQDLKSLFAEFKSNGLQKELSDFKVEQHGGNAWNVFYIVAPDGLCYWFGERKQD